MKTNSIQYIGDKLFKNNLAYSTFSSILFGLISNPITCLLIGAPIIWNPLYYPVGYNSIISASGFSFGWIFGSSIESENAFEEFSKNQDCWKIINEKIYFNNKFIEYNENKVSTILTDTSIDIGKLYIFCTLLFIERYEFITNNVLLMKELKHIHPSR